MPFEDVMGTVMGWVTATEALAALGAELTLAQNGRTAPPEIAAALRAVSTAGGLPDLDELPPPQRAIILGVIRMYVHHAKDLLDEPDRAAGWTYTDPAILDGWGRASGMVPMVIAASHPDLTQVGSFLDVGTGVGLLAVAAAGLWPDAAVVGIDTWSPSLDRAQKNVTEAGLDQRIELRQQDVVDLDDVEAFDCAWVPTFFVTEERLEGSLPALFRSLRPGGLVALGRMRSLPDPLAEATASLRTVRAGGAEVDTKRAVELLEQAGFVTEDASPSGLPIPLELILGRRPIT